MIVKFMLILSLLIGSAKSSYNCYSDKEIALIRKPLFEFCIKEIKNGNFTTSIDIFEEILNSPFDAIFKEYFHSDDDITKLMAFIAKLPLKSKIAGFELLLRMLEKRQNFTEILKLRLRASMQSITNQYVGGALASKIILNFIKETDLLFYRFFDQIIKNDLDEILNVCQNKENIEAMFRFLTSYTQLKQKGYLQKLLDLSFKFKHNDRALILAAIYDSLLDLKLIDQPELLTIGYLVKKNLEENLSLPIFESIKQKLPESITSILWETCCIENVASENISFLVADIKSESLKLDKNCKEWQFLTKDGQNFTIKDVKSGKYMKTMRNSSIMNKFNRQVSLKYYDIPVEESKWLLEPEDDATSFIIRSNHKKEELFVDIDKQKVFTFAENKTRLQQSLWRVTKFIKK